MTSGRSPLTPIRSRHTFEELRRSRIQGRSGPLTVVFVPQSTWSRPEVAYAINKKLGNAVTRNRLRRRLRSILSDHAGRLPDGAYLIRARAEAPNLTFDQLKVAMSQALDQALERTGGLITSTTGEHR